MKVRFGNLGLLLRRFAKDDSGAVAMIYGLMIIVLLLAIGIAIDYSRSYMVKKEIARALDASVLAAGSLASANKGEMEALAVKYFNTNLSAETKAKYQPVLNFDYDDTTGVITASSSANVDTLLMNLAGYDHVAVRSDVGAGRSLVNLEVALVLDNSGSMWGDKMSNLQDAAKKLVDTLYSTSGADQFVKFSLVPFTAAVNVGSNKINSSWIDKDGDSVAAQEDFHEDFTYWNNGTYAGMTAFDALGYFGASWKGCVRARVGEKANEEGDMVKLDLWDIPYKKNDVNSKWALHVRPVHTLTDGYGGDPSIWQIRSQLENVYNECPDAKLLPLTNKKNKIKNKIDDMNAGGWTNIPTGLMWGWRLLSPAAPYKQGVGYDASNTRKVIVVLTDGQNNVGSYDANKLKGSYSAYGPTAYQHLGTGYPGNKLDDKLEDVCVNVKSKGILIYSITFELNDGQTKDLMRDCATREDMYFDSPSGAALQDAFEQIAIGLQSLQLTK